MPFTPKYEGLFESLIIDNVLAVVQRDMKLALDYFYRPENLPDLAQRTLGRFISLSLPALAIEPKGNSVEESEGGSYLSGVLSLTIFLAVEDADATEVTRKLMKYCRALDAVLKTASEADYMVGVTPNRIMAITREASHTYELLGHDKQRDLWMRPATFELVLTYSER